MEFMIFQKGNWMVDPSEPSEVQRLAIKYLQRGLRIFSSKNRVLKAETCFERVTSNGTSEIYVVPQLSTKRSRPAREEPPAKR